MVASDQLYALAASHLGKIPRVSTKLKMNRPQSQSVYRGEKKEIYIL
jgi:hypothetical protein